MRSRYIYIIGSRVCMMLAVLWLLACTSSDSDDPQPSIINNGCVAVDLALSVSATNSNTRMASGVVKPTSLSGLSLNFSVLPFIIPSSQDTISSGNPLAEPITSFSLQEEKHYLSNQVDLSIGTNAFLCYAYTSHATTSEGKATNGSLVTENDNLSKTFQLEGITQPGPSAAILAYMNYIAGLATWPDENTLNSFKNIVGDIAGSSKNIIAYVNSWLSKTLTDDLKNAIKNEQYVTVEGGKVTAIKDQTTNNAIGDYPEIYPDGSAVIEWNDDDGKKCFEYKTYPTYAYPAERYFYANSRIKTSTSSQASVYGHENWQGTDKATSVLANYAEDNATVTSVTRSVAVKQRLGYGVAGLKIHIKSEGPTLLDANNKTISLGTDDNNSFKLTAIIVGSQIKQNCFFEPFEPSDNNEQVIYDTNVPNVKLSASSDNTDIYTLGLQTKEGSSMKVVLEFENNIDDFHSQNGVIYKGTKFYMVGSVVPPSSIGVGKQVMTRGHMSTVNLTIKSLLTAYNTLPDLSSDKLRLFDVVQAGIRSWQTGQTAEHEVYNW